MSTLTDYTLPIEVVEQLCDLMEERELAEVEINQGEMSIRIRRAIDATVSAPLPHQASVTPRTFEQPTIGPTAMTTGDDVIASPMPGMFYRSPSPEDPPFVQVGDTISVDDTICLIEAMKIFNEVQAEFSCQIVEVLVDNVTAVEFGQPLFQVKRI